MTDLILKINILKGHWSTWKYMESSQRMGWPIQWLEIDNI